MKTQLCPNCHTGTMEVFYEVRSVPTNSCILLDSVEEARSYPRGDIQLGFCSECDFISNVAFEEALTEYSGRYEETQGFSPTFKTFHEQLAARLVDKYNLRDKDVIEIGCGKGEFLALVCELGDNRGVGFDPGFDAERLENPAAGQIHFINDFYSEKYARYHGDLVCCKMTLEHIHSTRDFVAMVRRTLDDSPETLVFFQVPDVTRILRGSAFQDIYYEHCSYFGTRSLARLFHDCDFTVLEVATEYGGQYLTIESRPNRRSNVKDLESQWPSLRPYVITFARRCREKLEHWNGRLRALRRNKRKVVLWGSGSKAVSFLTTLEEGEGIEYLVDINPYRQGHHMPATGQRIVSPGFLLEYQPDVVVAMNPIYVPEISRDLDRMNLHPEVLSLD